MKSVFILFLVILSTPVLLFSQQKDAQLSVIVEKNEIQTGEPIHVDITLSFPSAEYSFLFPNVANESTAPFSILQTSAIDTTESNIQTTMHQKLLVLCYDTGMKQFPAVFANGIAIADGAAMQAKSDSVLILVKSMPVNMNGDIQKNAEPEKESNMLKNILITIAGLAIGIALFFLIRLLYKTIREKIFPAKTPFQKCMDVITSVEKNNFSNSDDTKLVYSKAIEAFKSYAQQQFTLPVLSLTTTETNNYFEKNNLFSSHSKSILLLLQQADAIKFAKQEEPKENTIAMLQQLKLIVTQIEEARLLEIKTLEEKNRKA
jgi:hypothetical protein